MRAGPGALIGGIVLVALAGCGATAPTASVGGRILVDEGCGIGPRPLSREQAAVATLRFAGRIPGLTGRRALASQFGCTAARSVARAYQHDWRGTANLTIRFPGAVDPSPITWRCRERNRLRMSAVGERTVACTYDGYHVTFSVRI